MNHHMKWFSTVLFVILLSGLICDLGTAYSETIELQMGKNATRMLDLNDGDVVSGRITLVGSGINFSITDAYDNIIQEETIIGLADFQLTATEGGEYSLHFENFFSKDTTFVTLNYNIQHYIFGFSQEIILLFAIVGLVLIAVIVFVALSPRP